PLYPRAAQQVRVPRLQAGYDPEPPPGSRDDDDLDLVIPGRVLAGPRDLAQHPEVEGVQHLGPVERDRRPRRRLLVDDPLEPELFGRDWPRRVGLGHGREPNGGASSIPPISGGKALAGSVSLVAGVAGAVQLAVIGGPGD